jgi:hypothetical protein
MVRASQREMIDHDDRIGVSADVRQAHPVDPATLAIASVTWVKIEDFSSGPPTDFVFGMVKNPAGDQGFDDRFCEVSAWSFSAAPAAIRGMRS